MTGNVIWKPNQGFENRKAEGDISKGCCPLPFRMRSLFSAQGLCGIDSRNPQRGHNGSDEGNG
jgi:hypothetical protein